MTEEKQKAGTWSKGGQIQFIGGHAYGIGWTLAPTWLGTEEQVRRALENKTKTGNPVVDRILLQELECQKQLAEQVSEATKSKSRTRKRYKYSRTGATDLKEDDG